MITLPDSLGAIATAVGEIRAGGTDLQERRNSGVSRGPVVDLQDLDGRDLVSISPEGGLTVGSGVLIQDLAEHPLVVQGYPALAAAAGGLATPQIRARGTLGGNLLQRVRCWYFRHPDFACLKRGGDSCFARAGDHAEHACFDTGPCIAPHPSTLAVALLCEDATVTVRRSSGRDEVLTVPELLGDGSDPRKDHMLLPGDYLLSVDLPPPVTGDRGGYFRAIRRAHAEWPLIEVAARIRLGPDGRVSAARIVVGAAANRPIDALAAAAALVGKAPDDSALLAAGALAAKGGPTVEDAEWKARLIPGSVLEACARALAADGARAFRVAPVAPDAPGATP